MTQSFSASEYKTRDGKSVFTMNKSYSQSIDDTCKDKSGRIWNLLTTTFEGKTTQKWVCEDPDNRFTASGYSKEEIQQLDGNIKVGKSLELAQSAKQELVLD